MDQKVTLDAEETQQALESAIRTQAQVILESSAFRNGTINGSLICGDESALLMELTGRLSTDPAGLVGTPALVRIYSDRRYGFPTSITASPQWGETRALAFDRPSVMTVMDRRRFVRARLAPSSVVKLEWRRGGVDQRSAAMLLNISADGIACRVEDPAAQAIDRDSSLRVRFALPGQGSTFSLGCVVSNVTPGNGGATILGLQFVLTPETREQIERLRGLLKAPQDVEAESEVLV